MFTNSINNNANDGAHLKDNGILGVILIQMSMQTNTFMIEMSFFSVNTQKVFFPQKKNILFTLKKIMYPSIPRYGYQQTYKIKLS